MAKGMEKLDYYTGEPRPPKLRGLWDRRWEDVLMVAVALDGAAPARGHPHAGRRGGLRRPIRGGMSFTAAYELLCREGGPADVGRDAAGWRLGVLGHRRRCGAPRAVRSARVDVRLRCAVATCTLVGMASCAAPLDCRTDSDTKVWPVVSAGSDP